MYRPPDIDNFQDFWAYYRNRWIGLPLWFMLSKLPNSQQLALQGLDTSIYVPASPVDAGDEARVLFSTYLPLDRFITNHQYFLSYKEVLAHAQFGQPQIGMIEHGRTAAFYEKGSPRIAHRGLQLPRRTDLFVLNGFVSRGDIPSNGALIWQCFNPTFHTIEAALRLLDTEKRFAVPLAPDWALSSDGAERLLWFRTEAVAYMDRNPIRMFAGKEAIAELLELEPFAKNWSVKRA